MNTETVVAVAELLGALGVIVTLLYLARQTRAAREATQQAAMQDLMDGTRMFLAHLSGDATLSRLWRLGLFDSPDLSPDEKARFSYLMLQLTYDWMRIFHFNQDFGMDAWMMESHRSTRHDIVSTPGFRSWYDLRKNWLTADFRAVLEREMTGQTTYRSAAPLPGSSSASDPSADGPGLVPQPATSARRVR